MQGTKKGEARGCTFFSHRRSHSEIAGRRRLTTTWFLFIVLSSMNYQLFSYYHFSCLHSPQQHVSWRSSGIVQFFFHWWEIRERIDVNSSRLYWHRQLKCAGVENGNLLQTDRDYRCWRWFNNWKYVLILSIMTHCTDDISTIARQRTSKVHQAK